MARVTAWQRTAAVARIYFMSAEPPLTNLESRAQNLNMRIGLVSLGISLMTGALLVKLGASPWARSVTVAPMFLAAYAIQTALYCTCGFTALAGFRFTNRGPERIADANELSAVRGRGLRVIAGSVALALVATGLLVSAS